MQSTSWETLGWKKHKLESRLPGEISITSDMQMTPPYGRKWRGTKKPLDESERGEWKSWLKAQHSENEDHDIWSHHFMGNRWGNSGNSVRLCSKITVDGDCSHEIKRRLLLGRKVMTNLGIIYWVCIMWPFNCALLLSLTIPEAVTFQDWCGLRTPATCWFRILKMMRFLQIKWHFGWNCSHIHKYLLP